MQGVGKETDIGYLTQDGVRMLDEKSINILDEIYNIELNCGKKHHMLDELNI